jgi:hypothetical protein
MNHTPKAKKAWNSGYAKNEPPAMQETHFGAANIKQNPAKNAGKKSNTRAASKSPPHRAWV